MSTGIYSYLNLCYNFLTQVRANTWLTEDALRRNTDTLDKEKKLDITKKFQKHVGDTGSTEVQVALLTDRINRLTGHMRDNLHDYHTQRGLLKLVGRRRRLLSYLSREDIGRYRKLIKGLGLRK
jgi:small subunit ribosomal protein S15